MTELINLKKDGGAIVFLGGMNAMPMMYAMELKNKGYDVLYLVDVPVTDTLSRPENHFEQITYPYPAWILEFPLKTQMVLPLFRGFFASQIKKKIFRRRSKVQAIFFNGFFTALIPCFLEFQNKIALSHGSDLDTWADIKGKNELAKSFRGKSIYKLMPNSLSEFIIKRVVDRQFFGFASSDMVVCFPHGFNNYGDRVLDSFKEKGVRYLERYDVSFDPLKNQRRGLVRNCQKLVIFSGVRFTFETFSEGNSGYNKGNDVIIEGLSMFFKVNSNIEIHFVEKGPDVQKAKKLIEKLGLANVVIWHQEMKFFELLKLYEKSDVCFDQVGKHWIGAIGFYALWLGKPLIANDMLPVKVGIWPKDNPVLSAASSEEVFQALIQLCDFNARSECAEKSMDFAENYLAPNKLLDKLFTYE